MSRDIKQIIIHCADTPAKMDIGADEIRDWHVNDNGWSDIGYNYVVRRNGMIENGRDLDGDGDVIEEVGAHARGFNTHSIGICLVGGKGGFNFTFMQLGGLFNLVQDLKREFPEAQVIGHRDVDPGKDCPGFDVRAWWANHL